MVLTRRRFISLSRCGPGEERAVLPSQPPASMPGLRAAVIHTCPAWKKRGAGVHVPARLGRVRFRCDGYGWHICSPPRHAVPSGRPEGPRWSPGLWLGVLLLSTEGLGTTERCAFCVSSSSRTFQVDWAFNIKTNPNVLGEKVHDLLTAVP